MDDLDPKSNQIDLDKALDNLESELNEIESKSVDLAKESAAFKTEVESDFERMME